MTDSRRVRIIKNLTKRRRRDKFPLYNFYPQGDVHELAAEWWDRFREGKEWLK